MRTRQFSFLLIVALLATAAAAAPVSFDAQLEPPAGRVISGWAQFSTGWDLGQPAGKAEAENLAAYQKAVAPHPPAMISFEVAADATTLPEFLRRYRELSASHGFFVAQIAFNFRGNEHDVAIGMRDPELLTLGDALKEFGRPVFLRIGAQFNQPGALYEPSGYIGAFRHGVERLRFNKLNFAAVWSATAQGFSASQQMKWYPGDDVVDWWALDVVDTHDLALAESKAFVDDAAHHRKPTLINANPRGVKSEADALKFCVALFDFVRANPTVKGFTLEAGARFVRWPKVAAYLKQQLADPRLIDANQASEVFRPSRSDR